MQYCNRVKVATLVCLNHIRLLPNVANMQARESAIIDTEWYISITPSAACCATRGAIICNAMQLFGPALTCGELRPDLTVHMHEQCILNQVGGGTGACHQHEN